MRIKKPREIVRVRVITWILQKTLESGSVFRKDINHWCRPLIVAIEEPPKSYFPKNLNIEVERLKTGSYVCRTTFNDSCKRRAEEKISNQQTIKPAVLVKINPPYVFLRESACNRTHGSAENTFVVSSNVGYRTKCNRQMAWI